MLCRNHGTWNLPAGNYQVTVGIKAEPFDHSAQPKIVPLANGVFDASKHDSQIQVDASTRGGKRVRHVGADFLEILDSLKAQGKVPGGCSNGRHGPWLLCDSDGDRCCEQASRPS